MNFLQMADAVLDRLGAASNDGLLTAAVRKSFVNAGLRAVEADLDHPDWLRVTTTFNTANGTGSYAVPAGWAKTISLRITTEDRHLDYVGSEALDETYGAAASSKGTPAAWYQEAGFLYLRPVPDSVVTIEHRYVRNEPELTLDSDTPLLPTKFHDAVVERAAALAAGRIGEYDRARWHEGQAERWVQTMRDEQNRVTTPARIRGR